MNTALCASNKTAKQLSATYGSTVGIVAVTSDQSTVDCPQFVCPCNSSSSRRLLQTGGVSYVYQYPSVPVPPTLAQLSSAIAAVLPKANVTAIQTLAVLSLVQQEYVSLSSWLAATAAPINNAPAISAAVCVLLVVLILGVVYFVESRKPTTIVQLTTKLKAIPVRIDAEKML